MNVASLELCKELYELSQWGWGGANDGFAIYGKDEQLLPPITARKDYRPKTCPAYDLGYLLRKLPRHLVVKRMTYHLCILNGNADDDNWIADYVTIGRLCWMHEADEAKLTEDPTVENAACKLAIELFKQGVLTREAV